jgi:hypothetical protein
MKVTQSATTIDTPAPASFTCSQCPFARLIEDNRYCCQVSQTASDVKRGHWEATISCYEALAAAEAEKLAAEVEAPIAQPDTTEQTSIAPKAPAAIPAPSKTAAASHAALAPASIPAATGTNNGDEPPHRGDNGRGRVRPVPAKKLMLSLVSVKRITSDVPACNFDPNELEIAGELSLTIGGFIIPPVVVRDASGYKVISGHFQFHAAVLARRLNPRAGETIPAIVLEAENQSAVLAQLAILKHRAA